MPQTLRVDHEAAVMSAHQLPGPDMAGLAVHFDFGDLGNHGLPTERVCDAASGQDISVAGRFWRRARIPAIYLRGCLENRDGPSAPETGIVGSGGGQHLHTEFQWI